MNSKFLNLLADESRAPGNKPTTGAGVTKSADIKGTEANADNHLTLTRFATGSRGGKARRVHSRPGFIKDESPAEKRRVRNTVAVREAMNPLPRIRGRNSELPAKSIGKLAALTPSRSLGKAISELVPGVAIMSPHMPQGDADTLAHNEQKGRAEAPKARMAAIPPQSLRDIQGEQGVRFHTDLASGASDMDPDERPEHRGKFHRVAIARGVRLDRVA
jgi:hypothetical protein